MSICKHILLNLVCISFILLLVISLIGTSKDQQSFVTAAQSQLEANLTTLNNGTNTTISNRIPLNLLSQKIVLTSFNPSVHGFHFDNRFVNELALIPGLWEIETRGRCGGMAFAALDYYHYGIPIPNLSAMDFPLGVPPDGHPLADYIYDRLIDSFFKTTSPKFITWTKRPDNDKLAGPFTIDGVRKLTDLEILKLTRLLDSGKPAALGLIKVYELNEIGRNHQVVAYGYKLQGGIYNFYIYDNNYHDISVVYSWNPFDPARKLISSHGGPWRGFFVQDYSPEIPRYQE